MSVFRLFTLVVSMGLMLQGALGAEKTKARLILSADIARPGDTVMAAVELSMPGKWHTYWRNAGESGMATKITWQLPEGVSAGNIQWPVPEKYIAADLTTYVYHKEALLLVPLTLHKDLTPGPKDIRAKVSWLECEDVCIPGGGNVKASLSIGSELRLSKDSDRISAWEKVLPPKNTSFEIKASWEKSTEEDTRPLLIQWESGSELKDVDFYPYSHDDYEVSAGTERVSSSSEMTSVRKTVFLFGDAWPDTIHGLIVNKPSASLGPQAFEVAISIGASAGNQAGSVAPPPSSIKSPEIAVASQGSERSLLAMLGLAFLGGLILNIMPCVLPVIALKILGFVNQSKEEPGRVRQLGIVYAVGVVTSFLVLAGLVIGVQQAGRAASWGMQFQNPQFLIGMTLLVTLVALNLFGLFEITLSGGAMGAASTLASKEGAGGAFFHGVLATALATPCTAPFLGIALGFAFAQSPAVIALMFATIGLGLASPYVVLSWNPAWLKFIPKPGVWMQKFKVAMGFPMLATAIWLLWLTSSHFGKSGVLWLGLFLVAMAMATWVWGDFVQRGVKRRGLAMVMSLLLAVGAYLFVLEGQLNWRSPVSISRTGDLASHSLNGIMWNRWSPQAVEMALADGRPVLVDFTADWCLTCQANKKWSLEIPSVREKLKEINAVALLGDHTNIDPAITAELKKYERAGVPLVLIYPAGAGSQPYVLPELLTADIVLEHLEKATAKQVASR